jgi:hypothetical protein
MLTTEKNSLTQAWRPGICSAFPLVPFKDYVEKEDYLEFKVLGISLYPLVFLSNGLKITLSIIPIASRSSWVEKAHG